MRPASPADLGPAPLRGNSAGREHRMGELAGTDHPLGCDRIIRGSGSRSTGGQPPSDCSRFTSMVTVRALCRLVLEMEFPARPGPPRRRGNREESVWSTGRHLPGRGSLGAARPPPRSDRPSIASAWSECTARITSSKRSGPPADGVHLPRGRRSARPEPPAWTGAADRTSGAVQRAPRSRASRRSPCASAAGLEAEHPGVVGRMGAAGWPGKLPSWRGRLADQIAAAGDDQTFDELGRAGTLIEEVGAALAPSCSGRSGRAPRD